MLPPLDSRPRTAARGPEPLRRRSTAAPALVTATPRRRKILNGLLAFATAVLLIDALVGDTGLLERVRARASFEQAEASLNRLRAENKRLREQVRRYRSDRSVQEGLVREKLGYVRPGEVLFIVRDVQPASR